jgi:hypothetical protein
LSEKKYKKYQHEEFRVVLDDCFSNGDVASALTAGGYVLEQFTVYFPRGGSNPGAREQGVKDSRVIALSHRTKKVVLTTDHRMCHDHKDEFLKNPEAMVVASAHKEGGDDVWVPAFLKAKNQIERLHKKQGRPWYAQIDQHGHITKCTTIDGSVQSHAVPKFKKGKKTKSKDQPSLF